jgi:hypothetical protein
VLLLSWGHFKFLRDGGANPLQRWNNQSIVQLFKLRRFLDSSAAHNLFPACEQGGRWKRNGLQLTFRNQLWQLVLLRLLRG